MHIVTATSNHWALKCLYVSHTRAGWGGGNVDTGIEPSIIRPRRIICIKVRQRWMGGGGQNIDKRRGSTVQNAKLCSNPNPFGNLLAFSRPGKTGFLRPRHIHCESGPSHKILSSFRACNKTPAAPERALHKNMTGMRGSDSPGLNSVPDMNWRY